MKATRRTFLAGVAAASLPAAAVACEGVTTAQIEPSALVSLIAAYNEVTSEADRIDGLSTAIWESPERPPVATLEKAEVSYQYRWHMHHKVMTRNGVNELFDGERNLLEANTHLHADKEYYAGRCAKIEEDRAHHLAIWEAREARYQEWATSSGFHDLGKEQDRLSGLENDLNEAIIAHPIKSLEDARMKAAHIKKVYGSSMSGRDQEVFLATLINAGDEA